MFRKILNYFWTKSFDNASVRNRILAVYAIILTATAAVWIWAICKFSAYPVLLGSAFLAYTLGLRHAVDADHIAAIDNVTRKLIQDGKRPVNVGFFFSLGHSFVVLLASACVAATAGVFKDKFVFLSSMGNAMGTCISAGFLLIFGLINIMIFFKIYTAFKQVKETGVFSEEDLNLLLSQRGFFQDIPSSVWNNPFKLADAAYWIFVWFGVRYFHGNSCFGYCSSWGFERYQYLEHHDFSRSFYSRDGIG